MTKKRVLTRRRNFLLGIGALTVAGGIRHLNNPMRSLADKQSNFDVTGDSPLRNRAAAQGLIYGAASHQRNLSSDAEFATHFAQECGILVPEWELKWGTLRPSLNSFNFAPGDWMAQFARTQGLLLRGHTLVWHEDLPKWFHGQVNSQNARQVLTTHIATVVKHYAGQIHSWDVVNEAVVPTDKRADGLRNSPWLKLLGPDYIEIAFRAAAEADPKALLVYNDHRLDYDTGEEDARRTAVLRLLERLKSRGVPVHALGMQGHLRGDETRFNPTKLKTFLRDVANLGLKIMITEMDVTDQKLSEKSNARDQEIALVYENYLSVVLEEPAVIAVLTWGLSDRYTWLSKYKPRQDKSPVRPLPLDVQLKRKLAWNAIARAFDKAPKR